VRLVRMAMEMLVLLLVVLSPWAFGAVEPFAEFLLGVGVGVLLVLWAVVMLLEGRLTWKQSPVALCLAGLFLLGIVQVTPLSRSTLTRLAPATARLYERLLPTEPEVLPGTAERGSTPAPPGSTLSLYPAATRRDVLRLLAIFLLFVLVRNNLASAPALRRLSVVAVANAAALSAFALVQYFTSRHNTLYWTWPSDGEVFGPFVCRNHFSFYVNLCVGLGLGLILDFANRDEVEERGWSSPFAFLQDPRVLWTGAALTLMLGAVVLSLSRGGFLALLAATTVGLLLAARRAPRSVPLGALAVVAGLAFLVIGSFGLGRVQARLATVTGGTAFHENRLPMWSRVLPSVADFPLWGSGYGTFDFVELLTRRTAEDTGYLYEHAHNDYLEALLEGGLVRLVLSLLAIAFVFVAGSRALRRHAGQSGAGLALGALFAFTTLVVHSFVDFGLHLPAIALFAAVVSAQLCGLGEDPADKEHSFRLGGVAPLAGALTAAALALVLAAGDWRYERVEHWHHVATQWSAVGGKKGREQALAALEVAAALAPESGRLHAQIGKAQLDLLHEGTDRLVRSGQFAGVAQTILSLAPTTGSAGSAQAPLVALASWQVSSEAQQKVISDQVVQLEKEHVAPALRHLLLARDTCPLLADVQLQLALNVAKFDQAEPRSAYLARIKLLAPDDPDQWYLCGLQEHFDGDDSRGWESWRRSLELSDRHLSEVVERASKMSDVADALNQALPERPALWLAAASQLYPGAQQTAERRLLLEKALALLGAPPGPRTPDEWHTQATLCAALGQPERALSAFQRALDRDPRQLGWRYELARLLYEQRRLQDARRELLTIIAEQPGNGQARELLDTVAHELARGT
jgi:tetratricopeptide (TPR) repeat protein